MSTPQAPQLCPHHQNPKACLTCFHMGQRAPKAAPPPRPAMGGGMAPAVAPPHIQRAIDRMKGIEEERVVVPPPQGPQALAPRPREPKPAQQQQAMQGAGSGPPQPWRSEEKMAWVVDEDGVHRPAAAGYRSIIDSLPRHPEAK